ncbi:5-oxoprolinase subunit PxpA [Clostridium botulinum]|uniref:5-oxoprolinase subunit A n=1 Tax=Clostridium botulinum C/D str. DC5 TaxID=1443128 RepID=A0A0A0IBB7_CLOBO|nr:5-oxoprolinase subunit PxpA [Clostridium botulinum]KEI01155.1 LamB/YcsF family protein [Clostridium botulinum C/D str. BKT75002]KEI13366.1 LamB/YcsF family protein [Clostridium botulinum C/D str. BKT2873]KGM95800.1 LamB/YcsF family protein [Clostridium botulinum D str. CCUG 7971]KGM98719.1 LamB/YcsF family protein [Clostridium botulinum C/D str. DC5]KOC47150.1 lactam utilization protein LamB [Clostridium botulinum]
MNFIDLNCDMGESFGTYSIGNDKEILKYVSSANIACGFHAGDPSVMNNTVKMALESNVAIGAHVGFQDLMGFGRRIMNISPREAYDITVYQLGALYGFTKALGGSIKHVKPHGALYNMAAIDEKLAKAIVEAIYDVDNQLVLFGLSGSKLIQVGKKVGLRTANEVFADRTYTEQGTLTPRSEKNALIKDNTQCINQVISMIKEGKVTSCGGKEVAIKADTICIHGDGDKALDFVKDIRAALEQNGVMIRGF